MRSDVLPKVSLQGVAMWRHNLSLALCLHPPLLPSHVCFASLVTCNFLKVKDQALFFTVAFPEVAL